MTPLKIADRIFTSRLFTGTGKFASNQQMQEAIEASESQLVTVAMRRIRTEDKNDDMLQHILRPGVQLLPNTSGVRNAKEAIFAAQLAREACETNWLKSEIQPDPRHLLPDSIETLKPNWDLWYFPTVRQIRCFANSWKMRELPLSCPWGHPSVPIKDYKPVSF